MASQSSLLAILLLSSTCSAWPFWPVFESNLEPDPPLYYNNEQSFGPRGPQAKVPEQTRSILQDESDNAVDSPSEVINQLAHVRSQLFVFPSNKTGLKVSNWRESAGVNPEELGEYAEGDILYPAEMARNGIKSESARWPNGVVPYLISPFFNAQQVKLIHEAMADYHKYTCIRFKPYKGEELDYIRITAGNTGCWSSVGRVGGKQDVNLQVPACLAKKGTIIHELMHAIGFLHEHSRYERDQFVDIQWQNIVMGRESNFVKSQRSTTDAFGIGYDYGSVMHYTAKAFSRNGEPTIIPKGASINSLGQRAGFSRNDIEKIQRMYQCSKRRRPNGYFFWF